MFWQEARVSYVVLSSTLGQLDPALTLMFRFVSEHNTPDMYA